MEIILTKQESEKIFQDALCNGLGQFQLFGLQLDYNSQSYTLSKQDLKNKMAEKDICFEDVLMNILRRGGELNVIDVEGNGENNATISIADVWDRVQLTTPKHLFDAVNERGDAIAADSVLQSVFFKKEIFI